MREGELLEAHNATINAQHALLRSELGEMEECARKNALVALWRKLDISIRALRHADMHAAWCIWQRALLWITATARRGLLMRQAHIERRNLQLRGASLCSAKYMLLEMRRWQYVLGAFAAWRAVAAHMLAADKSRTNEKLALELTALEERHAQVSRDAADELASSALLTKQLDELRAELSGRSQELEKAQEWRSGLQGEIRALMARIAESERCANIARDDASSARAQLKQAVELRDMLAQQIQHERVRDQKQEDIRVDLQKQHAEQLINDTQQLRQRLQYSERERERLHTAQAHMQAQLSTQAQAQMQAQLRAQQFQAAVYTPSMPKDSLKLSQRDLDSFATNVLGRRHLFH